MRGLDRGTAFLYRYKNTRRWFWCRRKNVARLFARRGALEQHSSRRDVGRGERLSSRRNRPRRGAREESHR